MPSKPVYKPTPGAISIPKWILKLSMRARFLATDYFASHSRIKTLRDYQFLPLPLQNLPPFDPPLGIEIPFFDLDLCFPSEIYGFLIENAPSRFLSDVVPRFLHAGEGTSIDSSYPKRELQQFRPGSAEIGVSEVNRLFLRALDRGFGVEGWILVWFCCHREEMMTPGRKRTWRVGSAPALEQMLLMY